MARALKTTSEMALVGPLIRIDPRFGLYSAIVVTLVASIFGSSSRCHFPAPGLSPRTKIVSFSQVSNALGTITPAPEMVEMAHRHGARVLVDGAQSVSHMRTDVQALDCDFYVFSGHKVFGPTGIGVVYGKADLLDKTPPWQGGGNMIVDVTFEKTVYHAAPARFEAGTGNIADAVGLGAALDYVEQIGIESIAAYEHELLN